MSFPRYPAYKDSGVEWIGQVPAHWEVRPVKNLARIVNGYPFDSEMFDAAEGHPLVRIRDLNKAATETYYRGKFIESVAISADDVLIGMDGDFNVGRWRGEGRALLNQRMCCVRGRDNVVTRLLEYCLPFPLAAINEVTYSTTVKHLASSQVTKTFVAIPPDAVEQSNIADFLDRETAKIDALVAEQRRLMELLKEKRQAVISHAVTKGLNPHAPMKPSGIEWLGDVPAHWRVGSLRYFARFSTGSTPDRTVAAYWDGHIPWVKTGEINYSMITTTEEFISQEGLASCSVSIAPPGTLLLALYGQGATRGRVALLGIPSAFNQACAAIQVDDRMVSKFLYAFFIFAYPFIREIGNETTQMNLNIEFVRRISVVVPPLAEQIAISDFIDAETTALDFHAIEVQRAIELLQERRTALISAAVTGQIDVRSLSYQQAA